ncbi:hypothetical protein D3C86_1958950 [compost metagenome]
MCRLKFIRDRRTIAKVPGIADAVLAVVFKFNDQSRTAKCLVGIKFGNRLL